MRRGPRDSFLRFCFRVFVARGSSENRQKIVRKSTKIQPKATPQINEKSILRRFGRPWPLPERVRTRSGRLLDAQMTPQTRSGAVPGEPRAARSCPKGLPGHPRHAPRGFGTVPKTLATPFASPNTVGMACRSIFDRFWINARKLRSAFRIGFYSVFSMSDVWRVDRSSPGKISKNSRLGLENRGSRRPGEARRSKFERKNGQVERKNALEVPSGLPKIHKSAQTRQLRARKCAQCPRRTTGPPKPHEGRT